MSAVTASAERGADVELRGIHKRYGTVVAVESLDLLVRPGEFVSLLGPSGCGKTNDAAPPPELTPGAEVQVTWGPNAARLLPE